MMLKINSMKIAGVGRYNSGKIFAVINPGPTCAICKAAANDK